MVKDASTLYLFSQGTFSDEIFESLETTAGEKSGKDTRAPSHWVACSWTPRLTLLPVEWERTCRKCRRGAGSVREGEERCLQVYL